MKIDHREDEQMIELAKTHNFEVVALEFGDYESDVHPIDDSYIRVERKSGDFLDSMMSGNIFTQIRNMNNDLKTAASFLVVDRPLNDVFRECVMRNMNPEVVVGYISSLTVNLHHPPVFLDNKVNTMKFIVSLFEKFKDVKTYKVHDRTIIGGEDILVFPGIDAVLGVRLLTHFGNFKNIVNASVEQLQEVNGIGKKKAEVIYNLCNKIYGDSKFEGKT